MIKHETKFGNFFGCEKLQVCNVFPFDLNHYTFFEVTITLDINTNIKHNHFSFSSGFISLCVGALMIMGVSYIHSRHPGSDLMMLLASLTVNLVTGLCWTLLNKNLRSFALQTLRKCFVQD